MIYFYTALLLYILFYGTWLFYVAFMHLKKHQKELKGKIGILKWGLAPFFMLALFMDVLFNFVLGTMIFIEPPRELLFTSRCSRHLKSTGWQLRNAHWICTYLLNPFDEGHCG